MTPQTVDLVDWPEADIESLERALGVRFASPELAAQSLTHKSLTNDFGLPGDRSNERLEFLGDSVIQVAVTELLFERFPDSDEGELTRLRSALVRASTLAAWARTLGLDSLVLVGRGDVRGSGRGRDSVLASTFEAVVGAVRLDRGLDIARDIVRRLASEEIDAWAGTPPLDAKSRLQQIGQGQHGVMPTYEVLETTGEPHSPVFTVRVSVGDVVDAVASGRSKQAAQQAAAQAALERLTGRAG
jgi:ribonuclease-3